VWLIHDIMTDVLNIALPRETRRTDPLGQNPPESSYRRAYHLQNFHDKGYETSTVPTNNDPFGNTHRKKQHFVKGVVSTHSISVDPGFVKTGSRYSKRCRIFEFFAFNTKYETEKRCSGTCRTTPRSATVFSFQQHKAQRKPRNWNYYDGVITLIINVLAWH